MVNPRIMDTSNNIQEEEEKEKNPIESNDGGLAATDEGATEETISSPQNEAKETDKHDRDAKNKQEGEGEDPVSNGSSMSNVIAHSSVCDRRLSRAARSILKRHLLSTLKIVQAHGDEDNNTGNEVTVWDLLDQSLASSSTKTNCALIPSQDLLKYHENHIERIHVPYKTSSPRSGNGISFRAAIYQQSKVQWKQYPWYKCLLCGKMFSSQYYIDQHMDTHHSHLIQDKNDGQNNNQKSNENNWICPGTTWCSALPFCSQHALSLEPYYGRGSSGLSMHDRDDIHRQLWYETYHPEMIQHNNEHDEHHHHRHHHYDTTVASSGGCDEDEMYQSKLRCYKMIHDCFGSGSEETNNNMEDSIQHQLEHNLCDSISCPNRLHQWFYEATTGSASSDLMKQHIHEWHDEWIEYYEHHHEIGWMGLLLIVVLAIGYSCFFCLNNEGTNTTRRRQKDPRGTRLLQSKKASSSLTSKNKRSSSSSKTKSTSSSIFGMFRLDKKTSNKAKKH